MRLKQGEANILANVVAVEGEVVGVVTAAEGDVAVAAAGGNGLGGFAGFAAYQVVTMKYEEMQS